MLTDDHASPDVPPELAMVTVAPEVPPSAELTRAVTGYPRRSRADFGGGQCRVGGGESVQRGVDRQVVQGPLGLRATRRPVDDLERHLDRPIRVVTGTGGKPP